MPLSHINSSTLRWRPRLAPALLVIFFGGLALAPLVVGLIAFAAAQSTVDEVALASGRRAADEVADQLAERARQAARANELLAEAWRRQGLRLEQPETVRPLVWSLMRAFPSLDGLWAASPRGVFTGYGRFDGELRLMEAASDGAPIVFSAVDGEGRPVRELETASGFVTTGRPWFRDARAGSGLVWGQPFAYHVDAARVALPCSLALRDAGALRGVVGSDFFLDRVVDAVRDLSGTESLQAALLDAEGEVLVGSSPELAGLLARSGGGVSGRVERGDDAWSVLRQPVDADVGLGWSVAVVLDEGRLLSRLRGRELIAAAVALGIIALVGALGFGSVRALTRPLWALGAAAEAVEPSDPANLERFTQVTERLRAGGVVAREVAQLAAAAGRMAERLLGEMVRLRQEATEHRRVADRAAMLALVAEATDQPVIIADDRGRVEWVNPAFTRDTGYPLEEMRGRTPGEVLQGAETDPEDAAALREAIREGRPIERTILNYARGGEPFFVHVIVNPVRDAQGAIRRFVGVQSNVTEARRRELELARWRDVFAHASWGVAMSDEAAPDRIGAINPALQRLIGRPGSEVQGSDFASLVDRDEQERLREAMAAEDGVLIETRVRRPDGASAPVLLGFSEVRDPDGRLLYRLAKLHDLSEVHALRREARQIRRMDALGRIAGGVAHDFNNALAVVQGNAQVLQEEEVIDGENAEMVDEILAACERARNLTRRLLRFSRGDEEGVKTEELGAIAGGLVPLLQKTLSPATRLELEPAAAPLPVRVNRSDVEDALLNLGINARHALPDGGAVRLTMREVEVSAREAARYDVRPGRFAELEFTDDGVGMPEDVRAQVFEPFFTTKGRDGTGLGMSEVFAMVRRRGGFMDVASSPGEGTTFSIRLPLAEAEARAAAPRSTDDEAPSAPAAGRVLVVDDEPMVARTAARVLVRDGFDVETVDSAEAALERLERGAVDLILSDVVMPGLGGLGLRAELAQRGLSVPLMFMSGHVEHAIEARLGAELLRKPFTPQELTSRVRAALDGEARGP